MSKQYIILSSVKIVGSGSGSQFAEYVTNFMNGGEYELLGGPVIGPDGCFHQALLKDLGKEELGKIPPAMPRIGGR